MKGHKHFILTNRHLSSGEVFLTTPSKNTLNTPAEELAHLIFKLYYFHSILPINQLSKWKRQALKIVKKICDHYDQTPFTEGFLLVKLWEEPLGTTRDLKLKHNIIKESLVGCKRNYTNIKIKSVDPLTLHHFISTIIEYITYGVAIDWELLNLPKALCDKSATRGNTNLEPKRFLKAYQQQFNKTALAILVLYYNPSATTKKLMPELLQLKRFISDIRSLKGDRTGYPSNISEKALLQYLWNGTLDTDSSFRAYTLEARAYLKFIKSNCYKNIRTGKAHREQLLALSSDLLESILVGTRFNWNLILSSKKVQLPLPVKGASNG